jgi:hypothetical protein
MSAPTETIATVECPCYRICSGLGVETGPWCRYHTSDLPPPGMHKFDPKDTWCPPGVQANVLMLAYMLAGDDHGRRRLRSALDSVRRWLRDLRSQPVGSYPRRQTAASNRGN